MRRTSLTMISGIALFLSMRLTLHAQTPRRTELFLDSIPADSVRCAGLTFQFARFSKDEGHHPLAGQTTEGSEKTSIDIWIWNRTDSARMYDPHMLAATNDLGIQIMFWSSEEVGDYLAGHHGLFESASMEARNRARDRARSRREYASGMILPGVSGGPRILVPDNDKHLDRGIVLYCGQVKLGLLHKR